MEQENEEKTPKKKSLFLKLVPVIFWLVVIYRAILWYQNNSSENELYSLMYQEAVKEVKYHLNASNVKVADFDEDNVVFQQWEYRDFGEGNLRYARYAVTVPVEYDSTSGHWEQEPTLNVYYYTSDQNVSEGVDPSIEAHIYTPDMFWDSSNTTWEK